LIHFGGAEAVPTSRTISATEALAKIKMDTQQPDTSALSHEHKWTSASQLP
jgi:hypothetical protein